MNMNEMVAQTTAPRNDVRSAATSPLPGAAEAAREIAAGRLTAEQLVRSCLDAIALHEPDVSAWTYYNADAAIEEARRKDRQTAQGPLHGVPFGVKDIIEVAGWPTGFGSRIYDGYVSPRDAACVALLKHAGAICLGKTVATELGHAFPGKTRNPHDLRRTPGGSSSGSAAAVAAGMAVFAVGTQTTGSVLRPAAFCGVIGYTPSYGDVVNAGVLANSATFDTVGVMCGAVEDLLLLRAALIRNPVKHVARPAPKDLRIGILREIGQAKPDATMLAALERCAATLSAVGAKVRDIRLPPDFEAVHALHRDISGYEFSRAIAWESLNHADKLSRILVEGRLRDGLGMDVDIYHSALRRLGDLHKAFADFMTDYDVLISPAAKGEAPFGIESTGDPAFNAPFSALHVPAVSLPAYEGENGCPLGIQVVADRWRDDDLLAACETIWSVLRQT